MAGIRYNDVAEGIKFILDADSDIGNAFVEIEKPFPFSSQITPWIGIYFMRRDAPDGMQGIRAGTATRYLLRYTLMCANYSIVGIDDAIRLRNDLISKVEVTLMKNRTLDGAVFMSWLEGGSLVSGQTEEEDWLSLGEILLVADKTTTTDV